jgi:hypothetical protein
MKALTLARNAVRDLPFHVVSLEPFVAFLFLDVTVASKTNEVLAIEEANAVHSLDRVISNIINRSSI